MHFREWEILYIAIVWTIAAKILEFLIQFHLNMLLGVQLMIIQQ